MLIDRYSALAEHFANNFATVRVIFENESKPEQVPFVRVTFLPVSNVRAEIGANGSDRLDGILNIDIFNKLGAGSGKSVEIANDIFTLYASGTSITTDDGKIIKFTTPQVLPGRDDGLGFYQMTVQCPWYTFKY